MMGKQTTRTKRHKYLAFVLGILAVLTSFSACRHNEVYYQFVELKDAEWGRDSSYTFHLDSTLFSADERYNVSVEVTNNVNYPYQNMWVVLSYNIGSDSTISGDRREYMLADEMGKWLGSGFGSLFQSSFLYKENIKLRNNTDYHLTLKQGMRDNPLQGIEKIGLKVERVN